MRAHRDGTVLVLGYGYWQAVDVDGGANEAFGALDDDFSRAAVCADGSYWVGGMSGQVLRCDADHVCEPPGTDQFLTPFASDATGCDADGALWWVDALSSALHRLDVENEPTMSPLPEGWLHAWGDAGRTWRLRSTEADSLP